MWSGLTDPLNKSSLNKNANEKGVYLGLTPNIFVEPEKNILGAEV